MISSKRVSLLLFLVLMKQTIGEDIRSVQMCLFNNLTFQCAQTSCLSFANLTTTNIQRCQIACLIQVQCKAATYYQPASNCQLHDSTINQNGNMSYNGDSVTMVVISGTRFPSGQYSIT